jgi:ABC-type Mn2+/Zn2+ transport system ATPase subunit
LDYFRETHYTFQLFSLKKVIKKTVKYFLAYLPQKLEVTIQVKEVRDFVRLPKDEALMKLTYKEDKQVLKDFFARALD